MEEDSSSSSGNGSELFLNDFKKSDEEDDDLFEYHVDDFVTDTKVDMQQEKEINEQSMQEIEEPEDELTSTEANLHNNDDVRSLGSFLEEYTVV